MQNVGEKSKMEAEFLSDLLKVCFNCLENSNGKGKVEDEN